MHFPKFKNWTGMPNNTPFIELCVEIQTSGRLQFCYKQLTVVRMCSVYPIRDINSGVLQIPMRYLKTAD